jgi:hypothetical protein
VLLIGQREQQHVQNNNLVPLFPFSVSLQLAKERNLETTGHFMSKLNWIAAKMLPDDVDDFSCSHSSLLHIFS